MYDEFHDEDSGDTFWFVYIVRTRASYELLKYYDDPVEQDKDGGEAEAPPSPPTDEERKRFTDFMGHPPKFYVIRTSG